MKKQNRGLFDETIAAMFSNRTYCADYLFYAHIVGQCSVIIDDSLPAPAGVSFMHDHFNLYINPAEFDEFSIVERLAIIKHEMLHIMLGHIKRIDDRNFKKWNYSTDCALNQLINSDHLPKCAVLPGNFSKQFKLSPKAQNNESSEYYYELIKDYKDEEQDGQGSDGQGSDGQGSEQTMDSHGTWKNSAGDETLQKDITAKMIKDARDSAAKNMGNIPSQCDEWLGLHNTKAQVNWRKTLRSIVGNKKIGTRSTIHRRDRRFPNREDVRGKSKNRTFNVLAVVDVSGSMSNDSLTKTMAEVKHICDVTKSSIDMIQVDTQAYEPEKFSTTTKFINRKACGGTELSPAIQKAKECNIDYQCIVVITDGYISDSDIQAFKNARKRVIWLIESDGKLSSNMCEGRMKAFKLDPK